MWVVLLSTAWERPRDLRVPGWERHQRLFQSRLFHRLDPQDPARLDPGVLTLPDSAAHSETKVVFR